MPLAGIIIQVDKFKSGSIVLQNTLILWQILLYKMHITNKTNASNAGMTILPEMPAGVTEQHFLC